MDLWENVNTDPLDEYKICSMTANPNNFAMWTHYAEEHKGICIGFIIDPDILEKEDIKCEKIIYAKHLPVIENFVYPYDFKINDLTWADIRKLIFYKLNNWEYEDEWRLVKRSDKPNKWQIGKAVRILCGYLGNVSIGKDVRIIGRKAFAFCNSLTSIVLPEHIVKIGNSAFRRCSKLTSVTMPVNIRHIGLGAFDGCPCQMATHGD